MIPLFQQFTGINSVRSLCAPYSEPHAQTLTD
jgi:hypothetical protein